MSTHSAKRLALLVSIGGTRTDGSPAELAVRLIERIDRHDVTDPPVAAGLPVAWNLPSWALSGSDGAPQRLRDYLSTHSATASFVPMGHSGAANVVLRIDELESEIEWARTSIWSTGALDLLREEPPLIVPRAPDTLRREALRAYGSAGVTVAIIGVASDGEWLSIQLDGEPPRSLPVLATGDAGPRGGMTARELAVAIGRRRRAARPVASATPILVWCQVNGEADLPGACDTIASAAALVGRSGWSVEPLQPELAVCSEPPRLTPVTISFGRETATRTMELRRHRASKINTRRVLGAIAGLDEPSRTPAEGAAPRSGSDPRPGSASGATRRSVPLSRRDFIASMMGHAVIPGSAVNAVFDSGRLCGLHSQAALPEKLRPAAGCVRTGRVVAQDTPESCFSFESDISRGLRGASVLEVAPDRQIRTGTEYSFVGDIDVLIITQRIELPAAEAGVYYSMCVPMLRPESSAITGRFLDGSTYDYEPEWDVPEVVLHGDAFQVWDGQSRYTLIAVTPAGQPMPWSITLLSQPEPRVVLGGRCVLGEPEMHVTSLLLCRADLDDEDVTRALSGRLPGDVQQEIRAGHEAESVMRETPQAPLEL